MRELFKGKRFTVMGLDANGRGLQDAKFLLQHGATVLGTDLRSAEQLPEAVELSRQFPDLKLVLGEHRLEDFENRDFVIRPASAPLDSPYLLRARERGVPIVSDETLFLLNAPKLTVVGVTGTRGKTTVTFMIYEILKAAGRRVFLGGNVQGTSLLPLLDVVMEGDVLVLELDSWKLQSFADSNISPNIAVFTTFFPDHLNYYKGDIKRYWGDKTAIFKNQKSGDVLIVSEQVASMISGREMIVAPKIPLLSAGGWKLKVLGEHNRANAGLALAVARQLGIDDETSKGALIDFGGVPGRLQYLGEFSGVSFYNDTTATTPEGVMVALSAINRPGRIILIGGGSDKGLQYGELVAKYYRNNLKTLILFKGVASDKIWAEITKQEAGFNVVRDVPSMEVAVKKAVEVAGIGDVILLSPGAASFGVFKNEYDRGEQFNKEFARLK